jgi:hypothetical protein
MWPLTKSSNTERKKNVSFTISGQVENLQGIIRITSFINRLPTCNDLVKKQFSNFTNTLYRLPIKKGGTKQNNTGFWDVFFLS